MPSTQKGIPDPVFINCRRETWVILGTWLVFFLWVTGYCAAAAYQDPGETIQLTLGIPGWVFWGVFVPWCAASAFTIWYCLSLIKDDPLDNSAPESESGNAGGPSSNGDKERAGA